jgi:hypothetical protein
VPTEPLSKASPCANNKIEQFSDGVDEYKENFRDTVKREARAPRETHDMLLEIDNNNEPVPISTEKNCQRGTKR